MFQQRQLSKYLAPRCRVHSTHIKDYTAKHLDFEDTVIIVSRKQSPASTLSSVQAVR